MNLLNNSVSGWMKSSQSNLFGGSSNYLNGSSSEFLSLRRSLTDVAESVSSRSSSHLGDLPVKEESSRTCTGGVHDIAATMPKCSLPNAATTAGIDLDGTLKAMRLELDQMRQQLEVKTGVVEAVSKLFSLSQSTPNLDMAGVGCGGAVAGLQQSLGTTRIPSGHSSLSPTNQLGRQCQNFDSMRGGDRVSASNMDLNRYKRENAINNLKYKTSLCRHFEKKGNCPLAEDCQFAHGAMELRHIQSHPLYKTRVCRLFAERNNCPYGERCYYYHDNRERDAALMSRELDAMKGSSRPAPLPMLLNQSNQTPFLLGRSLLAVEALLQHRHPSDNVSAGLHHAHYGGNGVGGGRSVYYSSSNDDLEEIERKFHEQAMDSANSTLSSNQ